MFVEKDDAEGKEMRLYNTMYYKLNFISFSNPVSL